MGILLQYFRWGKNEARDQLSSARSDAVDDSLWDNGCGTIELIGFGQDTLDCLITGEKSSCFGNISDRSLIERCTIHDGKVISITLPTP